MIGNWSAPMTRYHEPIRCLGFIEVQEPCSLYFCSYNEQTQFFVNICLLFRKDYSPCQDGERKAEDHERYLCLLQPSLLACHKQKTSSSKRHSICFAHWFIWLEHSALPYRISSFESQKHSSIQH